MPALVVAVWLALASAQVEAANSVRLTLERIGHPQFQADQVELELRPARSDTPALLALRMRRLRLPVLEQTLEQVRFECQPEPVPAAQAQRAAEDDGAEVTWRCEGPLHWRGGSGWQLDWQADEALVEARIGLRHGSGRLDVRLPLGGRPLQAQAQRVPVSWLASLLPQLEFQSGRLDGEVEQEPGATGSRWRGRVRIADLGGQVPDGSLVFAGVQANAPFRASIADGGDFALSSQPLLGAGELLAGSIYTEWPQGSRVETELAIERRRGQWLLPRFTLRDEGFELDAEGRFGADEGGGIDVLTLDARMDLGRHYRRYLDGIMTSFGQAGLVATGRLSGRMRLEQGTLTTFDVTLESAHLAHPDDRYAIAGLEGELAFRSDPGAPAPTRLSWQRLSTHGLDLGAGRIRARSSAGELRLEDDLRLSVFGGALVASDLLLRPLAEHSDRLSASVVLEGLDVGQLSQAFGWPAFDGRLDGRLPQLRYVDNALRADGEIDIRLFDGRVRIAGLAVERPFGVAPALAADIRLDDLDLVPMTDVFGFGRIEGRLNGHLNGLRLIDWRPVAFDAELRTAEQGRRRISRLAVDQLTALGGGGGIQGRLLGAFDSFGYRRIGLSCRLLNEVCEMSGLDEAAGGYTILQGSGLPLITIRGFQSRIDWPVLVNRLMAIGSGPGPTIE